VDDEPTVCNAIKRLLEHAGHHVEAVDRGEVALEVLARRPFDLIITDFAMPGMKGDELVARIRKQWPTQRIIMATAFAQQYEVFGRPDGYVDAVLWKPFSLQDLHETIARVMESGDDGQTNALPPMVAEQPVPKFIPPDKQ
jgi:two-component system response regulator FlrC